MIFGLVVCSLTAYGQQDDGPGALITDRPDATESPQTVGQGFLQFETGAFFTRDEDNGLTTEATTFNTMLIRYGIFDNFELRVGWNFTETQFEINGMENPNVLSGLDPLLLGAKVGITEENGLIPTIGLI